MRDLAVLRVQGPPIPTVKLSDMQPREGASIALMRFLLGGALGFLHVRHRGGRLHQHRCCGKQFPGAHLPLGTAIVPGRFELLQLDAVAYPGNSGGPVFDLETGVVIGVVNMVLVNDTKEAALSAASGISYAIPTSSVATMLAGLQP
jgi:serine protease Do